MFTRQHYKKIAEALASVEDVDSTVIEATMETFRSDNPRFSAPRFIQYFTEEYFKEWDEVYNAHTVVSLLKRWGA